MAIMKNYIGLAISAHDPSIAIIDKNGELVYAEGAERRLQSKRAWGNPQDHVNYIEELVSQYCDPDADTVVGLTCPKHIAWGLSIALPILSSKIRRANQNGRRLLTALNLELLFHKSVLGLAAYGKFDQKLYDLIRPLIKVSGVTLKSGRNTSNNYEALHEMRRKPDVPAMEYADFAATAQYVFTEIAHEWLKNIYDLHISDNLILSGGCALNSSANGTILENTPFKELFVASAPADDGNSIGAAYQTFYEYNPYVIRHDGVLST